MANLTQIAGAGRMSCALCMHTVAIICWLLLHLCPATAYARDLANVDSPAWCAQNAAAAQPQCLRMEGDCRAALPDMTSAGGCPSRELEACGARQDNAGSWCALLCCIEPDNPACTAAVKGMPQAFTLPPR